MRFHAELIHALEFYILVMHANGCHDNSQAELRLHLSAEGSVVFEAFCPSCGKLRAVNASQDRDEVMSAVPPHHVKVKSIRPEDRN